MGEISLSELIEQTKESIRPFEYNRSTIYRYQMAWRALTDYFIEHDQVVFSKQLAEQFVLESKTKLDTRAIKKWQYKLNRLTVLMLIECYEYGHVTWKHHRDDNPTRLLQSAYILLHKDYLNCLEKEGKGTGTIRIYEIVSKQFLKYLEQKKFKDISEVQLTDVSLFIPFISKQYQPTSMRTVLSALRSFLRFVETKNLTGFYLSRAIPSSSGRKTIVVPTITSEEEQKLLGAEDRTTASGKRNYAMFLLALRTGLRSIDIVNLKMGDIQWKSNTIEIVQAKTGVPLVLPLLTDVGNAIADYVLSGRPDSQQPYIFLHARAPYQKLSGRSNCYGVSCKMMKAAGIRQGKQDRKGFHCLRHSLAARLLSEETPLPIISSILGHRDKDSTKIYLSTDLMHLRACALGLTGIEVTKDELL
ncbi:MAG: site-specific integrase [Terracidiphilus sp.]|jgi:integrase